MSAISGEVPTSYVTLDPPGKRIIPQLLSQAYSWNLASAIVAARRQGPKHHGEFSTTRMISNRIQKCVWMHVGTSDHTSLQPNIFVFVCLHTRCLVK